MHWTLGGVLLAVVLGLITAYFWFRKYYAVVYPMLEGETAQIRFRASDQAIDLACTLIDAGIDARVYNREGDCIFEKA